MSDETAIVEEAPTPVEETVAEAPPPEAPVQIEEAAAETPPDVEASVGFDQNTGKHLVTIVIRHPDPTVVAVNGRAVWEGQG